MLKKLKPYIISLFFTLGIALLSNNFVGDSSIVYESIAKPKYSPPAYVFGIVWPILYILVAISIGVIYSTECKDDNCKANKKSAVILYIVQFIFNVIWPILFFKLEVFTLSFVWIIILWLLIIKMTFNFYKINKVAAYMIVPYLLWVTFATFLNLMIAILN